MNYASRFISIVDDDRLVRDGLISLMRSAGFATQLCLSRGIPIARSSGRHSMSHSRRALPGMSGLELQSQLTATISSHRIPVVFITARDDEAARQRALKGGAVDFLRKPVRREALLNAVHSALQKNDIRL